MKTLLINTSDADGGAARATVRLLHGLRDVGSEAHMLVQSKRGDNAYVHTPKGTPEKILSLLRPMLDSVPLRLYRQRNRSVPFSPAILPRGLGSLLAGIKPDVVHLHWIGSGMLQLEELKHAQTPLVWTMHDMWPFTGGCHYDQECGRYQESCGRCPILNSSRNRDLSHRIWKRKQKAWQDLNLTFIAPSRWLAQCATSSSLFANFRTEVIPNGIDLAVYKPFPKELARSLLGLPQNKHLILFGAFGSTVDPRKGFQHLQKALLSLASNGWGARSEVMIFGASRPETAPDLGMPSHFMGRLHDDLSLSLMYSAADVFVAPSQQENLANTVMEALACGTPAVAFDIGGMRDLIEHEQNGYLAKPFLADDLAKGISWVLNSNNLWHHLSTTARQKCEQNFDLRVVARRHLALYEDLLLNNQDRSVESGDKNSLILPTP